MSDEWRNRSMRGRANGAVRRAVMAGILTKPTHCPRCGAPDSKNRIGQSTLHGHHPRGYDDPLDVEWLCVLCHRAETPTPAGERNPTHKYPEIVQRGMAHHQAKLTDQLVLKIRADNRRSGIIAKEIGVSRSTVLRARKGLHWSHITAGK